MTNPMDSAVPFSVHLFLSCSLGTDVDVRQGCRESIDKQLLRRSGMRTIVNYVCVKVRLSGRWLVRDRGVVDWRKGYHRKDVVGLLDSIVKSSQLLTAAPVVVTVASWLDRSGSWHQLNDSHRHSASEGRKMWGKGKGRARSGLLRHC